MSFTHGMDLGAVEQQQKATDAQRDEMETLGKDSTQAIQDFVESNWWGDDAVKYGSDWQEVTSKFDDLVGKLEEQATNITGQMDAQVAASES